MKEPFYMNVKSGFCSRSKSVRGKTVIILALAFVGLVLMSGCLENSFDTCYRRCRSLYRDDFQGNTTCYKLVSGALARGEEIIDEYECEDTQYDELNEHCFNICSGNEREKKDV